MSKLYLRFTYDDGAGAKKEKHCSTAARRHTFITTKQRQGRLEACSTTVSVRNTPGVSTLARKECFERRSVGARASATPGQYVSCEAAVDPVGGYMHRTVHPFKMKCASPRFYIGHVESLSDYGASRFETPRLTFARSPTYYI